ncbi:MAG TPA: amidohydrolase family protein [Steroidobacteraceae bacterium]|jgi:hypothetical protein
MLRALLATVLACLASIAAAAAKPYADADFVRLDKIDAHVHLHGRADGFVAEATREGFRLLTINVDYPDFADIDAQQRDAVSLRERYPGRVAFAASFTVKGFEAPDWAATQIKHLDAAFGQGAVGVKVWKNIGLELKDSSGRYVMLDDPRLKPIFDHLVQQHVVLLGHQAEPLNCWLPYDQMTVRSDREYFKEHPQYYMYRHPEVPGHDAQLAARDRMLAAHPDLKFDSVHLASLEWDVQKIAQFLDRFPEAQVDVAARMSHLEYQATSHPDKVRAFFLKYQDRILYGTDEALRPGDNETEVVADLKRTWLDDWHFLSGAAVMHSDEFSAGFRGLALPRAIIDKVYAKNARRLFVSAWSEN